MQNVFHVQKETGAQVSLSGKGCDATDGPLTLTITGGDSVSYEDFDKAVEMCRDLLGHVCAEAAGQGFYGGAKGIKGQSKSKSRARVRARARVLRKTLMAQYYFHAVLI